MKLPCEHIVWNIVPIIRKEFAKNLVANHNLTQKNVADMMDISEAAVSRYLSGKRGVLEITDRNILKEINIATERIVKGTKYTVIEETCRICTLLKDHEFFNDAIKSCKT